MTLLGAITHVESPKVQTTANVVADADVMATKPEHCEGCGDVVMMLLVNYPDASRKWLAGKWDSTARKWLLHSCSRGRATL